MFRDVQKKYSGTDASDVANLYLARIAASRNDVASARKLLEAFIAEHPKHLLVGAARYSLYQLRIENGDEAFCNVVEVMILNPLIGKKE